MNAISTQTAILASKDTRRYAGTSCNLDAKRVRLGGDGERFGKRLLIARVYKYFFVDNGQECTPGAFLLWNGIQTGAKTGIWIEDMKEAMDAYVMYGMLKFREEITNRKMITRFYSRA